MGTLYDVLGLSRQSDAAQIEQAYRTAAGNLAGGDTPSEQDMIRAKAIREAHAILSAPSRRQAYDAQLRLKEQATFQMVEPERNRWLPIALVALAMIGAVVYWKHHSTQLEIERIAMETAKVKLAADAAALLADAEEARLEQLRLAEKRRVDMDRARESAQARYEGQRIHDALEAAQARAENQKEAGLRRAKAEQAQEERAAQIRNHQREMDMRRALAIPIVRH